MKVLSLAFLSLISLSALSQDENCTIYFEHKMNIQDDHLQEKMEKMLTSKLKSKDYQIVGSPDQARFLISTFISGEIDFWNNHPKRLKHHYHNGYGLINMADK